MEAICLAGMVAAGEVIAMARKRCGMTRDEAASRLGVSRQTISKWELGETVPNVLQAKGVYELYDASLDDMLSVDPDLIRIRSAIDSVPDSVTKRVDWTKAWSRKYPILASYQAEVGIEPYAKSLEGMISELKRAYGYGDTDAFLVLKDILATVYKSRQK